jgi:hypothetical protein
MDIVYSAWYNGMIIYVYMALGIFLFTIISIYKAYLKKYLKISAYIIAFGLILDSLIKIVFFDAVHVDTSLPVWFSPMWDFILFLSFSIVISSISLIDIHTERTNLNQNRR